MLTNALQNQSSLMEEHQEVHLSQLPWVSTNPADRAGVDQCSLGSSLLVSTVRFLLLCCLLGVLLLGLNLLLPTSHGPQLRPAGTEPPAGDFNTT